MPLSKPTILFFFFFGTIILDHWGFPCIPSGKDPRVSVRDTGSIPGWGRSPGGERGNPLQYSSLENLMDRGAWQATVHMVGYD